MSLSQSMPPGMKLLKIIFAKIGDANKGQNIYFQPILVSISSQSSAMIIKYFTVKLSEVFT